MPKIFNQDAKHLKKLPRGGRVAVIARAMRRTMPLITEMLGKNSKQILESIELATQTAGRPRKLLNDSRW